MPLANSGILEGKSNYTCSFKEDVGGCNWAFLGFLMFEIDGFEVPSSRMVQKGVVVQCCTAEP